MEFRTSPEESQNTALSHWLRLARRQPPLSRERERELLRWARSDERWAVEELADANLMLVAHVACSYDTSSLDPMDLIAQGSVALISACRRYRAERDGSFRRYCLRRIGQAVEDAVMDSQDACEPELKRAVASTS
jgi:DNA-directed RNA polymerase sigma subunit (sigma70/sigma32)